MVHPFDYTSDGSTDSGIKSLRDGNQPNHKTLLTFSARIFRAAILKYLSIITFPTTTPTIFPKLFPRIPKVFLTCFLKTNEPYPNPITHPYTPIASLISWPPSILSKIHNQYRDDHIRDFRGPARAFNIYMQEWPVVSPNRNLFGL